MKKIFTLSFLLLLFHLQNEAQGTVQASLGEGSASNRVKIYIKSDITETTNISTLEFDIAVPDSVNIAKPVITSSASSITWTVASVVTEGGYHNFAITTGASPLAINLTSGVEFEVMEVEFSDYTNSLPTFTSLVTLPDGGNNTLMAFYCTGSPQSDGSNLYYARNSDPHYQTTIDNQFSYDITGATSGTTTSYARMVASPTPVKLSSFSVNSKNNDAVLNWNVENQDANSNYFGIERSTNGTDFTQIGIVNATSSSKASYSYTDNNNLSGAVYYRIKMVDKDGQFAYSDIKSVEFANRGFAVSLYPNPVQSLTKLNITLDEAQVIKVTVNDALGNRVKQLEITGQKGANEKTLDLSNIPTGSYMIRIQAGQNNKTLPVIKN